jgi:hypothetical protein
LTLEKETFCPILKKINNSRVDGRRGDFGQKKEQVLPARPLLEGAYFGTACASILSGTIS